MRRFNSYLHGRRNNHPYKYYRDQIIALWKVKNTKIVIKQYESILKNLDSLRPNTGGQKADLMWCYKELDHVYMTKILNYQVENTIVYSPDFLAKVRKSSYKGINLSLHVKKLRNA